MSQGQQYPANNYSQYTTMNQPPYPPPHQQQQGYPSQYNSGGGGGGGGMSHAPPMNQRISTAGPDSAYPPPHNQSGYAPPHPPMSEAGRPMSAYNPPPMRPQSQYTGRPQSQYNPNPSSQYYQHGKNKNGAHYGHLVTQEPDRDTACGGDACGACCKYNTLACLFCCNGWLRLCGRGMSIKDILSFK